MYMSLFLAAAAFVILTIMKVNWKVAALLSVVLLIAPRV